jgi:transaldolase
MPQPGGICNIVAGADLVMLRFSYCGGCADAIVKRAHSLLALYEESGVSRDKLIFRVPATWAAIQAAGQLEKEGVATQAFHIYRCEGGPAGSHHL